MKKLSLILIIFLLVKIPTIAQTFRCTDQLKQEYSNVSFEKYNMAINVDLIKGTLGVKSNLFLFSNEEIKVGQTELIIDERGQKVKVTPCNLVNLKKLYAANKNFHYEEFSIFEYEKEQTRQGIKFTKSFFFALYDSDNRSKVASGLMCLSNEAEIPIVYPKIIISEAKKDSIDKGLADEPSNFNAAYYVIGTTKQLKEWKIIYPTGNICPDASLDYFTKVDITKMNNLQTSSKKPILLSNHPTGSYKFDADKQLVIIDYLKFWSKTIYLVIVTVD